MYIGKIRHRELRRFYEDDDASVLPAANVKKIRNILATLEFAPDFARLIVPPGWRLHQLKGDRADVYAINVTGNWRITFRIVDEMITDLNFEDYH